MFNFFKKRNSVPEMDSLAALSDSALAAVKGKWIVYDSSVKLNDSVSLGQKIDLFADPLLEFFRAEYPALLLGGWDVFWLTVFTAVLQSGTHSKEEINAAISQLRSKYPPEPNIVQFKQAIHSFIAAVSQCALEMSQNASYIEGELQNVVMSENLRDLTQRLCTSLHATSEAAKNELDNWRNEPPNSQDLASRTNELTDLLFRNTSEMHGIVMALRSQSDLDRRFSLGSMLVGESASNILIACNTASDAAKAVSLPARA